MKVFLGTARVVTADEEADDLIDGLLDNTEQLSPWEFDFVASVDEQRFMGRHLTRKQRDIWDEMF